MDDKRFFRFIQRFNSILFLVVGILAVILLTFVGYRILQETTRTRHIPNMVNMRENRDITESWEMSYPEKVSGTPFIMIPLRSSQSYDHSYYDKSLQSLRNILFIDTETDTRRWLFDNNDNLILSNAMLNLEKYNRAEQKALGILYHLVAEDTDGNKRLTREDRQTLAVSAPDGTGYTMLVENIDTLTGHHVVDEKSVYIFFMKDGEGYSTILSLVDNTLTGTAKLPAIGGEN